MVDVRGIPHLAKNERDARISCTWYQATATCAAFIEESRIKFINANKLHRKSGGVGHPSSVAGADFFSGVSRGTRHQRTTTLQASPSSPGRDCCRSWRSSEKP